MDFPRDLVEVSPSACVSDCSVWALLKLSITLLWVYKISRRHNRQSFWVCAIFSQTMHSPTAGICLLPFHLNYSMFSRWLDLMNTKFSILGTNKFRLIRWEKSDSREIIEAKIWDMKFRWRRDHVMKMLMNLLSFLWNIRIEPVEFLIEYDAAPRATSVWIMNCALCCLPLLLPEKCKKMSSCSALQCLPLASALCKAISFHYVESSNLMESTKTNIRNAILHLTRSIFETPYKTL